MAFTYNSAAEGFPRNDIEKVRLLIGDINSSVPLRQDEEIAAVLEFVHKDQLADADTQAVNEAVSVLVASIRRDAIALLKIFNYLQGQLTLQQIADLFLPRTR